MPDDVALFIEARDGQQRSLADPCGQVIRVVEPALGIGVAVAALEAGDDPGRFFRQKRANLDVAQARLAFWLVRAQARLALWLVRAQARLARGLVRAQARPRYARTAAESLSGVKPKCSASTFQGADAPKPFMP